MRAKLKQPTSVFANPFVVMWLVVGMYAIKSLLKIYFGTKINSPMIAGDGYHNAADILEALAVLLAIWVSRRPTSDDYPFGKKNIEFFTSLLIGIALLIMGFNFALQSLVGLTSFFPEVDTALRNVLPLPAFHPLVMGDNTFGYVVGLTVGSVITSFLVSRYQIAVGKATGHESLIADGEETASDGSIELITVLGVFGEYFFHAPWLEYPLGLLVAFLIANTGRELLTRGLRVLLQHSIGAEHEREIRSRSLAVVGVEALASLKTFQIGSTAVCLVTVVTEHDSSTIAQIKYGLEFVLNDYLIGAGFKESELHIKFQKPDAEQHRIAYAVVVRGEDVVIATTLEQATNIFVCDVKHGDIVLSKKEPKPDDIADFLRRKRVSRLYLFTGEGHGFAKARIGDAEIASCPSFQGHLLGLSPGR